MLGGSGNDGIDGKIGDDFCVEGERGFLAPVLPSNDGPVRCEFDFIP